MVVYLLFKIDSPTSYCTAEMTFLGTLLGPGTTLAILVGAFVSWLLLQKRPPNMPPGPRLSLPVFGYVPFLGHYPWISLAKMTEKYGNIMTMRLGTLGFNYGTKLSVVLNDYDSIKAALNDQADEFESRGPDPITEFISTGKDGKIHGIMNMEGEKFYAQHDFIVRTLRDLGVNGARVDELILDEFEQLYDALVQHGKSGQHAMMPFYDIKQATMNILGMILFGKRYDYEEKTLQSWPVFVRFVMSILIGSKLRQISAVPGWVVGKLHGLSKVRTVLEESLESHIKTYRKEDLRNFLDVYIRVQKEKMDTEALLAMADKEDLFSCLNGMFTAGPEATAIILWYSIFYHLKFRERQKQLQDELFRVVGNRKRITYADKESLPYMSSTMYEVVRMCGETPLGQSRENPKAAKLLGYTIPARTQIIPNFWAVHYSAEYFPDPFTFKPERFLTDNGKSYALPPQYIHWSIGKLLSSLSADLSHASASRVPICKGFCRTGSPKLPRCGVGTADDLGPDGQSLSPV
ncbi:hypothetical protein RvY_04126-2 [Ramazzottius varieornatus]|uniref:Cytochrome P450 n=1 Tax=Ramazzottius varieornatus TaxID=947166 RepID=A0A1D1UZT8_RAMVA|nr:hypothetical protein RvY_04126-2 [Ramazzottius varieornatus]